jgi:two-component system response regulator BaeR
MRVLLLEDERELRHGLAERLRAEGHVVDEAADGPEGWYIGHEYPIDVAVVDLGLPGVDGAEVIRRWRNAGRRFPVLVLTARGRWQEKVSVLELGADDYISKAPFSPREVVARVKSMLRRNALVQRAQAQASPTTTELLHIDELRHQVSVRGEPLNLTPLELRLLKTFAAAPGQVFSREQLLNHLHDDDRPVTDRVIDTHIKNLRRKLEPFFPGHNAIQAVYGVGYCFELPSS